MNLMTLLGNLDFSELAEALNDDNSNVVNKLDFTKKEDLDKLTEAVNTFKSSDNGLIKLVKSFVGETFEETLDKVLEEANNTYNNAHKAYKETPKMNLCTPRKEIDKSIIDEPTRPSEKVAEEMQKQIAGIVTDYMKTKIIPNADLSDKQLTSIADGLYEFACWIYSR